MGNINFTRNVACVASVYVGLSAGLKHFRILNSRKSGRGQKSAVVVLAPILAPPKSEKSIERAVKPTETLASQATRNKTSLARFRRYVHNSTIRTVRSIN